MLRLNHMEITVPHRFVSDHGDDCCHFYEEIFGFQRGSFPGLETPHFVLKTDEEASQFLLVCETNRPLLTPGEDHLGFHLDSNEEVDDRLVACCRWKQADGRVELRFFEDLELEQTSTRSFFVRYLLPIWFDVQHITRKPGFEAKRRWRFE